MFEYKYCKLTKNTNGDIRSMLMIRLWLVVVVLTVVSWVVLKLIRKPWHIGWVLLFWVVVIFGSMLLIYGTSIWLAGE